MERLTWASIGAGLDDALAVCRKIGLGLQVERSRRFQEHRACLAELTAAWHAGGSDAARELFDRDRVRACTALTEAAELVESLPFIRTLPWDRVGSQLAVILQGSPLPTDAAAAATRARDALFELTMASQLWRAGWAPDFGAPGLRCWGNGRVLYLECKRPVSRRGARQAHTDALEHLTWGLRGAPAGARGIVALSIGRFVNPGDRLVMYERDALGKAHLSGEMTRVAEWLMRPMGQPVPPEGTIGLLWHVITPGFDRHQNLLVVDQQLTVQPMTPPGSADEILLRALFRTLRAMGAAKGRS
ncbi:MAG TPA: hypothetical protein VJX71_06820 [Methylomirabilota bacterium]|nr:hypothetical protein [Methylomirabilota bacterium]